jgi:hypothetical protein
LLVWLRWTLTWVRNLRSRVVELRLVVFFARPVAVALDGPDKLAFDDYIAGTFPVQESFHDQIEERFGVVASVCSALVEDVEVGEQVTQFGVRLGRAECQLDDLQA